VAEDADYIADVRRYAKSADAKAVAAIVRHLGIALRSKDAACVASTSKSELARVRESWLKAKLALTDRDADLDKGVASVSAKMKADKAKSRVTFYYLLAEHYGKLGTLAKS